MTENYLQKLEEKTMVLISAFEESQKEIHNLKKEISNLVQEITALKTERDQHGNKIKELISLVETVTVTESIMPQSAMMGAKPVLVQG